MASSLSGKYLTGIPMRQKQHKLDKLHSSSIDKRRPLKDAQITVNNGLTIEIDDDVSLHAW